MGKTCGFPLTLLSLSYNIMSDNSREVIQFCMSFYKEDSLMRSDQIKKGVERAPNRSLLYALGYTEEELNRPLVGLTGWSWCPTATRMCRAC